MASGDANANKQQVNVDNEQTPTSGVAKDYAKDFAAAQIRGAILKKVSKLQKHPDKLEPPSKTRYLIAKIWALVGEVLDVGEDVLATLLVETGAGPFVVWILGILVDLIIFDIPLALIIGNGICEHASMAENSIKSIDSYHQNILGLQAQKISALPASTQLATLRGRGFESKSKARYLEVGDKANKKAFGRLWKSFGIDMIPYIELYPTRFMQIRKEEKLAWKIYEIAKEAEEELENVREEYERELAA